MSRTRSPRKSATPRRPKPKDTKARKHRRDVSSRLARALGTPVWLCTLPCPDWVYLGTTGFPWLPDVSVWRRRHDQSWAAFFTGLQSELIRFAEKTAGAVAH